MDNQPYVSGLICKIYVNCSDLNFLQFFLFFSSQHYFEFLVSFFEIVFFLEFEGFSIGIDGGSFRLKASAASSPTTAVAFGTN